MTRLHPSTRASREKTPICAPTSSTESCFVSENPEGNVGAKCCFKEYMLPLIGSSNSLMTIASVDSGLNTRGDKNAIMLECSWANRFECKSSSPAISEPSPCRPTLVDTSGVKKTNE